MALAVLVRYGGVEDDPHVVPVRTLLDEKRTMRARVTGLALRLAHTLSGGAPDLLSQTKLRANDREIVLDLPGDAEIFLSEAVDRRFGRLARAMGLRPRVGTRQA